MPIARTVASSVFNAYRGPTLGASGKDFDDQGSGTSPTSITLNTQASGSSIFVMLCGFLTGQFGNPTYNGTTMGAAIRSSVYFADKWSGYGMQMHSLTNISGGTGHAVAATKSTAANESSMLAAEIRSGLTLKDSSIVARDAAGAGIGYASGTVTTDGPALLLLGWTGDGDTTLTSQAAAAEAGWSLLQFDFRAGVAYVQAALWAKEVAAPGTYSAIVTPVDNQGGILGLAAYQA